MQKRNKPKLGQNFLVDPGAQRRIVEALGPSADGTVVEIGPGGAAITSLLADRAQRLIAIELDPRLAALLRERFQGVPTVEVLEANVLQVDLTALAASCSTATNAAPRRLSVVGNLPYYITSPILQHLFAHQAVCSRAVVMVQREVAERMTAEPGTREYGLLSVLCRLHAEPSLLFTLGPEAFQPAPEVQSAVVRLEFRESELRVPREPFTEFLRMAFAQKRKTLGNNLRASGLSPATVAAALRASELPGTARAEELLPEQLAAVWRVLGALREPRHSA